MQVPVPSVFGMVDLYKYRLVLQNLLFLRIHVGVLFAGVGLS